MTLVIPNADSGLLKILSAVNAMKDIPYKLIKQESPNEETLKAIEKSGLGESKQYESFDSLWDECEEEIEKHNA